MAKRKSRTRPVTIPIRTLSGGVGRQAPSKRLPTEAENIDNAFVTLERSIEKRNGFEIVERGDSVTSHLDLFNDSSKDIYPFWLQVSDRLRFLFLIDYKATEENTPLFYVYMLANGVLSLSATVNNPTAAEREYFTWGSNIYSARESLRVINVGANVLILNRNVEAGFSSGKEGKKFDYNGNITDVVDNLGGPADYLTVGKVDPEGIAEPVNVYSLYLAGDEFIHDDKVYRLKKDFVGGADATDGPPWDISDLTSEESAEELRDAVRISVRDYVYPNVDKAYLGQAVENISKIKFPPITGDSGAFNNAASRFANNYPNENNGSGNGKVYYSSGSFGATSPGYYRVVSETDRPYLHKVLTPDSSSVLDDNRMPHKIFFDSEGNWQISTVEWDPRTGGTNDTNPGISIFKDGDGNVRQAKLGSMAFYRDRLFVSSDDTIFSSKMGDYTDFWIADPSEIVATDPIDIQASSNKFTPIISMVPFSDFLFINTDSDTQYELLGSENQITPFTAELSPTAFYSTSSMVEPQLMGSQIYFYASEKMYLYFSSRVNNINKAVEVSSHCPNFLPKRFRSTAVAPARDSIFVVDDDNPNEIYGYTNRFSGDQVTQNAFFRFTLGESIEIFDLQEFDDELYALVTIEGSTGEDRFCVLKMALGPSELDEPRIDVKYKLTVDVESENPNTVYDSELNRTTFTLPVADHRLNECILYSGWDPEDDTRFTPVLDTTSLNNETTSYYLNGNYAVQGAQINFGRSFTMEVELSPQFMRDDKNNVIDGVLNMRTIHLRHSDTGNYRVEATRRNRTPVISTFSPVSVDEYGKLLPLRQWENDGEFTAQVFGFGSETVIKIISDYPTPVNITNMEIKGKFKSIHSTALS
tara:strand:+ start:643 stop:3252 length:2610 start_codon:yes stop_codon:yes gene_type:complete